MQVTKTELASEGGQGGRRKKKEKQRKQRKMKRREKSLELLLRKRGVSRAEIFHQLLLCLR